MTDISKIKWLPEELRIAFEAEIDDLIIRYEEALLDRADDAGKVDSRDISRLASELRHDKSDSLVPLCDIARKCVYLASSKLLLVPRSNLFGRVLVGQFESMVVGSGDRGIADGALPRELLKGIFRSMSMIAGNSFIDQMALALREVMERISPHPVFADDLDIWNRFYRDGETKRWLQDLQVRVGQSFGGDPKRQTWFIDLMNTYMRSHHRGDHGLHPRLALANDESWVFTDAHFVELMRDIMRSLEQCLSTLKSAEEFERFYGDEAISRINAFLDSLR